MIAIDTRIQPFEGQEIEADKNWQDIFLADSQPELIAFFQECVDQNLILNSVGWSQLPEEKYNYDNHSTVRYYSVDLEKAEVFKQKLEDMAATFSLKKFWSENKFDFIIEQSLVDFDQEMIAFDAVNSELSEVWGTGFPSYQIAYSASNNNESEVDNK